MKIAVLRLLFLPEHHRLCQYRALPKKEISLPACSLLPYTRRSPAHIKFINHRSCSHNHRSLCRSSIRPNRQDIRRRSNPGSSRSNIPRSREHIPRSRVIRLRQLTARPKP